MSRRDALTPDRAAGLAIAAACAVALAAQVDDGVLTIAWAHALGAAIAGLVLWAGAGAPRGDAPWFAGVIARDESPFGRAAARAAVVLTAPVYGAGVVIYAAAALYYTLTARPRVSTPVNWRASVGTGLLGVSVVTAAVTAGVGVGSDGAIWAVLLVGSGLSLFWGAAGTGVDPDADWFFEHTRARTLIALGLAAAGAGVILNRTGAFGADVRTIVGAVVVVILAALVIGPRWLRNSSLLRAERTAAARQRERAEIAEMLHDSVLQTLALIQRRSSDPDQVAALARRQERELRDWLLRGSRAGQTATSLDEALRAVVAEIEDAHGVQVEAVIVGDARLGDRVTALVAAAREALINAAVHGGGAPISLFAKADGDAVAVYVHDRGPGFDPDAVAPTRHGLRESIIGRMERNGGRAQIRTAPGQGCEIALFLEGGR